MTEEQAIKVLCMIETHDGLAFKAKEMAIKNIRDMKKIKEIMECDANAETKCKMISYILTAKPHYFEEQKSCEDTVSRQAVDTLVDELARAISDERCCISRGRSTAAIMQDILDLPSVNPQEKIGHWIEEEINEWSRKTYCSKCGESALLEYVHVGDIYYGSAKGAIKKTNYCPHCGAKMIVKRKVRDKKE